MYASIIGPAGQCRAQPSRKNFGSFSGDDVSNCLIIFVQLRALIAHYASVFFAREAEKS